MAIPTKILDVLKPRFSLDDIKKLEYSNVFDQPTVKDYAMMTRYHDNSDNYMNEVLSHVDKYARDEYRQLDKSAPRGNNFGYQDHSYKSHTPNDIISAIAEFMRQPSNVAALLLDERNIDRILDHSSRTRDKMDKQQRDSENKRTERETTEKYNEAVDVIDELEEFGIDKLDEEQLEIHDEMMEIIKKYESS